jgi:hypothetical protein
MEDPHGPAGHQAAAEAEAERLLALSGGTADIEAPAARG